MIDLVEKSKELIKKLEALSNVNEKKRENLITCLKRIISGYKGDDTLQMIKNSECYTAAFYFIEENGQETFEQLCLSTSNGQLMSLFKKHQKSFTDEEYWENLIYTYTRQDYQQNDYKMYVKLFSSKRKYREKMMSPEEQDYLNNLPDIITIYRGGSVFETENGYGISWSLNKDIAIKFVNIKKYLSDDEMVIHEIQIPKKYVVAYINNRKEEEIIFLGEK